MQGNALIVGACVARLSAGSYLQKTGTKRRSSRPIPSPGVYAPPGSEATMCSITVSIGSWVQSQGRPLHIWQELEALGTADKHPVPIRNLREFTRIDLPNGETVHSYADAGRLGAPPPVR